MRKVRMASGSRTARYRKQIKKAMALFLLLTMAAAVVQPFDVAAADQTEESAKNPEAEEAALDDQVSEEEQGNGDFVTSVIEEDENPGVIPDVPVPVEDFDADSAPGITITSVRLERDGQDVNGQEVKDGDTVKITVEAKSSDGILSEQKSGSVIFYSAEYNQSLDSQPVPIEFKEEDGKYQGALKIQGMRSGEWYIGGIQIDKSEVDDTAATKSYPYYILVCNNNDDTPVEQEMDVTIRLYDKDENGKYVTISSVKKKMRRRQTLKDIGVTLPEMKSIYPGQTELTQTGWVDRAGKVITEDTPLFPVKTYWIGAPDIPGGWLIYVDIFAKYDKEVLSVSYTYPDREGHAATAVRPIVYETGATYGEILQKAQFIPEDMTKEYPFEKWETTNMIYQEDEIIDSQRNSYLPLTAKFSGMAFLNVSRIYYDRKGSTDHGSESVFVKEGTNLVKAVDDILNQPEPPETYPGLRFQKWGSDVIYPVDSTVVNGMNVSVCAAYENCLIRYIISGAGTEESTIFCQTAEKGETVTALKSFQGFGEVTWKGDAPSTTFVVDCDRTFYGTAESTSDSARPSKPSGASGSGGTDNASDSSLDDKFLNPETEQIVRTINGAAPGAAFRIDMGADTVVSKEILEAARGKDVTLVLEMEGYSWTVNGTDIVAQELRDIDLRVIKNTDHIPNAAVQALAGDRPSMQISLAYDGAFGFQAALTIDIGTEYSGRYGNLFYYNSFGKMEFVSAGTIDGAGNVKLIFNHASDYLIVVSDQMMSQAEVPDELMPAGTTGQSHAGDLSAAGADGGKSVRTGDSGSLWLWIVTGMSAIGIFIYFLNRKRARA